MLHQLLCRVPFVIVAVFVSCLVTVGTNHAYSVKFKSHEIFRSLISSNVTDAFPSEFAAPDVVSFAPSTSTTISPTLEAINCRKCSRILLGHIVVKGDPTVIMLSLIHI